MGEFFERNYACACNGSRSEAGPGGSVGRALILGEQRVVGSNPTKSRCYFFKKMVVLGVVGLFTFALLVAS